MRENLSKNARIVKSHVFILLDLEELISAGLHFRMVQSNFIKGERTSLEAFRIIYVFELATNFL